MPTGTPTSVPASATATPTDVPGPSDATPTPTNTPRPTTVIVAPPATATYTPLPLARVTGRIVKDGIPVSAGVTVRLEDQGYTVVAVSTTDAQGVYTFDNLAISGAGFNVLFAQEWNGQYDVSEVISWAWLGPITISSGAAVEMPDLEIGLLGFDQVSPPAGASFSAGEISAQSPLIFEWAPYPAASSYWVDLAEGDDQAIVWQSALVNTTSVAFDGTLDNGSHIAASTYWWGVGARKDVGDYQLTIYGYLPALIITP